jgi:hypothetical protein
MLWSTQAGRKVMGGRKKKRSFKKMRPDCKSLHSLHTVKTAESCTKEEKLITKIS